MIVKQLKIHKLSGTVLRFFATCIAILGVSAAMANPVLDHVAAGQVNINQQPNQTIVEQSSQKAIINWQTFNIGAQESTHFQQPSNGVALNRINPANGFSSIEGRLTATGKIILVNPAGIYFGPSAFVNVGGLIASTADISDSDFLAGRYLFNATSQTGAIVNEGLIRAHDHGLVALVGGAVQNDGTIEARLGHVVLGSGSAFTLSFAGNDLINFSVDAPTASQVNHPRTGNRLSSGVVNKGQLLADGGQIMVSAKAAQGVLDNVINMEGIVQARSVVEKNGEIIFSGDERGIVRVAGRIDATGNKVGEKGGQVKIAGHHILVDDNAKIDVSGDSGGGDITIGKVPGTKNADAVVIMPDAQLLADASRFGDGGNIMVWSDNVTRAYGSLSAKGGSESGHGGFIETSGLNFLAVDGIRIDTSASFGTMGTWLLDPSDLTISAAPDSNVIPSGAPTNLFTADNNATTSNLNVTNLVNALTNTSVTVMTTGGGAGAGSGNITVASPINWSSATTLTLDAFNDIIINSNGLSPMIAAINGNLILQAAGDILLNGGITLSNGSLTLAAQNAAQSITTANPVAGISIGGAVIAQAFNLLSGQWFQVGTDLPTFDVTQFQINNNVLPAPDAQFLRMLSGTGAIANPYIVFDRYGLQGIASSAAMLGFSYQLNNDIDMGSVALWNGGLGFSPIGVTTNAYTGMFDGNNFQIINLAINAPASTDVGLFGLVGGASVISNLNITGTVIGNNNVGGIAGRNNGSIIDSNSSGQVSGVNNTGGAVGVNNGTVNNVISTGTVFGSNAIMGGLVGNNNGSIVNSNSSSIVTGGNNVNSVGGLVGVSGGSISGSFSTGAVSVGTDSREVGGLVGHNNIGGLVSNSFSSSSVTAPNGLLRLGGLVGLNRGTITGSNSSGTVNVTGPISVSVGGLVGRNDNIITQSFSSSTVIATNVDSAAGLVGLNETTGSITDSYSTGNVIGTDNLRTAGLIAENRGVVDNVFSSANVTGIGTITNLSVAGLIGRNEGTVTNAYSTGRITATGSTFVGGLIGRMFGGSIDNVYSTSPITATNSSQIGGLVGSNESGSTINHAFSAGLVSVDSNSTLFGGLVGLNDATSSVNDSFWNTDTTGLSSGVGQNTGTVTNVSGGCFGSACSNGGTVNLTEQATYTTAPHNWDFAATWDIIEGSSYPYLQAFYPTAPRAITGFTTLPNQAITVAANGSIIDTGFSAANGFYYMLAGNNAISGIDQSIADFAPVLAFINNQSIVGNAITLAPNAGGSIGNLNINNHTIHLVNEGGSLSTTDMANAIGALIDSDILYSAAGPNIILGNGTHPNINLVTGDNTTFSINGLISSAGGANLTFNGPTIVNASTINSGSGNQQYNDSLTLNNAVALIGNQISINNGVGGNQNLQLIANFSSLRGAFALQNLTITGSSGNNTLSLDTDTLQIWNITGTNAGNLAGIPGISGSFTFGNIQNLTGGNESDQFNFANGGILAGTVDGGPLVALNTLNYNAYQSPLSVVLNTSLYGGQTVNSNSLVNSFTNIDNITTNPGFSNSLTLPNKSNTLVITDARRGYVNDPLFFDGFNTFISTSGSDQVIFLVPHDINFFTGIVIVNGVPMTFQNFFANSGGPGVFVDISRIIQQPDINGDEKPTFTNGNTTYTLEENFDDLLRQAETDFGSNLDSVKINPYCAPI